MLRVYRTKFSRPGYLAPGIYTPHGFNKTSFMEACAAVGATCTFRWRLIGDVLIADIERC